jgi:hypothetical protein
LIRNAFVVDLPSFTSKGNKLYHSTGAAFIKKREPKAPV